MAQLSSVKTPEYPEDDPVRCQSPVKELGGTRKLCGVNCPVTY